MSQISHVWGGTDTVTVMSNIMDCVDIVSDTTHATY